MSQIPSMWRTELWHVVCLHFPIAVLLLATVAGLCRAFLRTARRKLFLAQLVPMLLSIGVATGWLAIYTGELAYDVVVRTICDPPALQAHQWWSYASTITYSVALGFLILARRLSVTVRHLTPLITGVLMTLGAAGLLYAGHLGASVVYQQGGGTYKPSADCAEFVR